MSDPMGNPTTDTSENQRIEDDRLDDVSGGSMNYKPLSKLLTPETKEAIKDGLDSFGKVTSPLYGLVSTLTKD